MTLKKLVVSTILLIPTLLLTRVVSAQTLPGDFNHDGAVNLYDFNLLISKFSNPYTIFDFNILVKNYGMTQPSNPIPSSANSGEMWISKSELAQLPTSGAAWESLRNAAYGNWGETDLQDQNNKYGLNVLAGALVYAKTGDTNLRTKVRDGILSAKRTMDAPNEWGSTNGVLSLGRQLGSFVIAADLIQLKTFDTSAENEFSGWLRAIRTTNVGTHGRWKSLTGTCENSANNWGTFACPSRIAASIYLNDSADVGRAAKIIQAWLGDRSAYPADAPGVGGYFQATEPGSSSGWPCNDSTWTAINPSCTKSSVNIDGAITEDASRGGTCCTLKGSGTSYSWEALQGIFVSTELLYRTGKFGNPYTWSNNALKRSMDFMQRSGWNITSPAPYVAWMANYRYGTNYPTQPATSGRIMSWGHWLYQK